MRVSNLLPLLALLLAGPTQAQLASNGATASFRGSLPPKPVAALSADQEAKIETRLTALTDAFQAVKKHPRAADADIFLKAVRYALDFDEWYDKKPDDGVKKSTVLLDEAEKRIAGLKSNTTPWLEGSGQKVVGFYSAIDDSPQPYGVEIPEGLDYKSKKTPLWIWLHGRGDTSTDLHFVYSRLMAKKPGQFQPAGTIVIHPFGRYCNGWKSAGETDVFECRDDATSRFNIDEDRIALAGFSMGGAGAWHLGAHFADQWACVHTGAGFADVKRYQKLTPDKYPNWFEQTLWGVYDVPDYARNFYNVPLISYSGEVDAQRDSAEYMMEVLGKEGLHPPHLIGPGMPHKYHPDTLKEVQAWVEGAVAKGRDTLPKKVVLQCRANRYAAMAWVEVLECEKQWDDTRVEAELIGTDGFKATTKNVVAFTVDAKAIALDKRSVTIDGQQVEMTPANISTPAPENTFVKQDGKWTVRSSNPSKGAISTKAGGTCIEDAFLHRFVIVLPEKSSGNAAVDAWVKAESDHFIQRWRGLMRGDPIIATVDEVIAPQSQFGSSDISLILWGTPANNRLIADCYDAKVLPFTTTYGDHPFPGHWSKAEVSIGTNTFSAADHVLCATYPRSASSPRDLSWGRIVINSGLTFREAHDRTNSLQNPKLPDWAILNITQPADAESAGKVVAADFFDVHWQVKAKK